MNDDALYYAAEAATRCARDPRNYRFHGPNAISTPPPPEPWPGPRFSGSAYSALSQGTYWVDRDRCLVPISGMTLDYVANVLAYLKDNAARIAKQVRNERRVASPGAAVAWPFARAVFLDDEELVATSALAQALGRRLADALDGKGAGR